MSSEIKLLENKKEQLEEENEILRFMVDFGKIPVQIYDTGIIEDFQTVQKDGRIIRRERYNVKYIDVYGVIKTVPVGFFHEPIFKLVKNNAKECIFTATEYRQKPVWYKLCKAKKLVVEIPKPYEYSDNNNNNEHYRNS
jgi:hypothetical protein